MTLREVIDTDNCDVCGQPTDGYWLCPAHRDQWVDEAEEDNEW